MRGSSEPVNVLCPQPEQRSVCAQEVNPQLGNSTGISGNINLGPGCWQELGALVDVQQQLISPSKLTVPSQHLPGPGAIPSFQKKEL